MDEIPALGTVRGSLFSHAPFDVRIKPDALKSVSPDFLAVVSALLPRVDKQNYYKVYGMLAVMGAPCSKNISRSSRTGTIAPEWRSMSRSCGGASRSRRK
jgi:hypothetical protein